MGSMVKDDPLVVGSWLKMFTRYWKNWENNSFDRLSTD